MVHTEKKKKFKIDNIFFEHTLIPESQDINIITLQYTRTTHILNSYTHPKKNLHKVPTWKKNYLSTLM